MTTIYIPPKLVEASYNLPLNAMRLRILTLARLSPANYLLGFANPITITTREWQDIFVDSGNPYRDVKRAVSAFSKATVRFRGKNKRIKFLEKVIYEPGSGEVELHINTEFLVSCH